MRKVRRAVNTRIQVQGICNRNVVAMLEFDYATQEELGERLDEAKKAIGLLGAFDDIRATWEESPDFLRPTVVSPR